MALKSTAWKAPSVETISTGLTYMALTGALLLPVATSPTRLPPAVEAKVSTSAPQAVSALSTISERPASQPAATELADQSARQAGYTLKTAGQPSREIHDIAPAQIAEAAARIKSVRAKEAAPLKPDTGPSSDNTSKSGAETKSARPAATADVRVTETEESAKGGKVATKAADKAPVPATAVVPVASGEPVNTEPATTWNEADVATALKECLRLLAPVNAEIEVNTSIRKGQCGSPAPILLKSLGTNPKVTFQPAVEINCQMAVTLGGWAIDTLQPAARDTYGAEVKSIVGASGYSCRNRYGLANERLSEHALANAIDIGGFALANGRTVKVSTGWGPTQRDRVAAEKAKEKLGDSPVSKADDKITPTPAINNEKSAQRASLKAADLEKTKSRDKTEPVTETKVAEVDGKSTPDGKFLRRLHEGACGPFGTVLGPEANEAHRDHLHFDLKARKHRAVCQ